MPPLAISILLFATVYHCMRVCMCVCVCLPTYSVTPHVTPRLHLQQIIYGCGRHEQEANMRCQLHVYQYFMKLCLQHEATPSDADADAVMRCATTPPTTAGHWRSSIAIFSRGNCGLPPASQSMPPQSVLRCLV